MRLKTKLVLAITALVFVIAGSVSLVYVHQLVKAAVQQSYDSNWMAARQVWFALQQALETGLRDRTVDPNDPAELRALVAETVQSDPTLRTMLFSVVRYSSTVYDVNIGDSQGIILLSSNPANEGKPLCLSLPSEPATRRSHSCDCRCGHAVSIVLQLQRGHRDDRGNSKRHG